MSAEHRSTHDRVTRNYGFGELGFDAHFFCAMIWCRWVSWVFRFGGSATTTSSTHKHHEDESAQPPSPQPTSSAPIPGVMFARSCHGTNLVPQFGLTLGVLSSSTNEYLSYEFTFCDPWFVQGRAIRVFFPTFGETDPVRHLMGV